MRKFAMFSILSKLKFSSPSFVNKVAFQRFWRRSWQSELFSYEPDCRTALDTLGLLKSISEVDVDW